jgi:undecaprenyl-diphosphatase
MTTVLHIRGRSLVNGCSRYITPREVLLMRRFCELRRYGWLTRLFLAASRLGDGSLWWVAGIVLTVAGGSAGRRATLAAALAIGSSVLLFMALKGLIGRPRPFVAWPALTCLLAPPDRFSFPSGHTMTAFAAWAAFAGLLPGCGLLFLPAAVLIGVSRVFLGLHYPTDVLVGALLGTGLGLAAVRLVENLTFF